MHVAAPGLAPGSAARAQLQAQGLTVHDIPLHRTGQNPLADLRSLDLTEALKARIAGSAD